MPPNPNGDTIPNDQKVAIVGIGCRYPGGIKDVETFWKVLADGVDCMGPPPVERMDPSFIYPGKKMPGKSYAQAAGFIEQDVFAFDRAFFKISPDEADHLDPQIRLLLEVVWESLQDAGVSADSRRGTSTGVFMGVMSKEYTELLMNPLDHSNQYSASGNNTNMISNRISYEFDFRGPSMSVDTACSSSMYAIYNACEAIKRGECDSAVAGGVNCNITPVTTIGLCQAGMLSGHGRCKSFDQDAGGYARGEGAGVVYLKSLEKAIADGDRIYAVVRGGALNNDGRTTGITTPNPVAQRALLEEAYKRAQVDPLEVPYVEAHGTGTRAGDRTEATAIGRVLGEKRESHHPKLLIGSVKSNFGHTEGAAGAAGVIKASLVLHNKQIPKVVHFQNRNKEIEWDTLKLNVPQKLTDWPEDGKLLAGCSSFGFGGANAHLILEGPPPVPSHRELHEKFPDNIGPQILTFSASTKEALQELTAKWIPFLKEIGDDHEKFADVVYTTALRSTHLKHRLYATANSATDAAEVLRKKLEGNQGTVPAVVTGATQQVKENDTRKLVFAFSGMGTQWWGMGRRLYQENHTFSEAIKKIDDLLHQCGADWSLVEMLTTEEDQEKINRTDIAQPSICSLQIALTHVYREWGIQPDVIVGHSVGEVAAAYCAGLLTIEDAVKLIYTRGCQLMKTKGHGGMVAVLHDVKEIQVRLSRSDQKDKIDVACINSPTQIVLSGDKDALNTITEDLTSEGIRCRPLKVLNAFHSYQQAKVKESFLEETGKFLDPHKHESDSQFPMMSTVTNQILTHEIANSPDYWYSNIRQTVFFKSAVEKLIAQGYCNFLEIGAHPALVPAMKDVVSILKPENQINLFSSLKRPREKGVLADDTQTLLDTVCKMHMAGLSVDIGLGKFKPGSRKVTSLPKYAWQRVICSAVTQEMSDMMLHLPKIHPTLGQRLHTSLLQDEADLVWHSSYSPNNLPWLRHHQIENVAVLPGAAFIETMLEAARHVAGNIEDVTLTDIQFHKFHFSPEGRGQLETTVGKVDENRYEVCIKSITPGKDAWITHATAFITVGGEPSNFPYSEKMIPEEMLQDYNIKVERDDFYKRLAQNGVQLGDNFASVTTAFFSETKGGAVTFSSLPDVLRSEEKTFNFHPALLDSTFQSLVGAAGFVKASESSNEVRVPKSVGKLNLKKMAPSEMIVQVIRRSENKMDVLIADKDTGEVFASMCDVTLERIDRTKEKTFPEIWQRRWTLLDEPKFLLNEQEKEQEMPKKFLLIEDEQGVTYHLKDQLSKSFDVAVLSPEKVSKADDEFSSCDHVIILSPLNLSKLNDISSVSKSDFLASQSSTTLSLASVVRKIKSIPDRVPTVWVVTQGAKAVDDADRTNPLFSSAHAFGITMMHEEPKLHLTSIDLPLNQDPETSAVWLKLLLQNIPQNESELALRSSSSEMVSFDAYSLRIELTNLNEFGERQKTSNWQLHFSKTANDGTQIVDIDENSEVQIPAEGNTFVTIDAITPQDYYESASKKEKVGLIFGGHVTSLESAIHKDLGIQDRVLGFHHEDTTSSSLAMKSDSLIPIPPKIDTTTAVKLLKAGLPYYIALERASQCGKNLLLCQGDVDHVEFTAITKMARLMDYDVHVLSETDDKPMDLVEDKNMKLFSSEELECKTKDHSFDVVIIPDGAVTQSGEKLLLKKLKILGTAVKISEGAERQKRDSMFMRNLPRNISAMTVDMTEMWAVPNYTTTLQVTNKMLEKINQSLNGKRLPIPECTSVSDLLDCVQENKLPSDIITVKGDATVYRPFEDIANDFKANGNASYLVTGGTKGLGVQIVKWLVSNGAQTVYVTGRNQPTGEAAEYFDYIKSKGVSLRFVSCSVDKEEEMKALLENISKDEAFPLEGVFHCAAVFRNVFLLDETKESWDAVLSPKAYGALLIHQLTEVMNIKLKHFVLFSSILEYLGNDGQASYTAANYFLSMLGHVRRQSGLPASVVLPGTVGAVGYAAREGYGKLWMQKGLTELRPEDVLKTVSWLLTTDRLSGGITAGFSRKKFYKMNLDMFKQHFKTEGGNFSTFKHAFSTKEDYESSAGEDGESDLISRINELEEKDGKLLISQNLSEYIMVKLGISQDLIEGSLVSLGIDSLMSSEFSGMVEERFGAVVKAMELLNDKLDLNGLTSIIYDRMHVQQG